MKTIFIILFFLYGQTYANDKINTRFNLSFSSDQVDNTVIYSPELEVSYYIVSNLYFNFNLGLFRSFQNNYRNSDSGYILTYQKVGLTYNFYNTSRKNTTEIIHVNNKIRIKKYKFKQSAGYYINTNIISANTNNGDSHQGYSLKIFREFDNSPFLLGLEHINVSDSNFDFKINTLVFGVSF